MDHHGNAASHPIVSCSAWTSGPAEAPEQRRDAGLLLAAEVSWSFPRQ